MIEITITEIWLFCWAIVATGAAFKFKDDARSLNHVLRIIIEDDKARDRVVAEFKEFKERHHAQK